MLHMNVEVDTLHSSLDITTLMPFFKFQQYALYDISTKIPVGEINYASYSSIAVTGTVVVFAGWNHREPFLPYLYLIAVMFML